MSSGEELKLIRLHKRSPAAVPMLPLMLLLALAGAQQATVECFWLADTSLFQPVVGAAKPSEGAQLESPANASSLAAPAELAGQQWSRMELAGQVSWRSWEAKRATSARASSRSGGPVLHLFVGGCCGEREHHRD